jgi:hypothetical protein
MRLFFERHILAEAKRERMVDWQEHGLPRLAPSQAPPSARREDDGEEHSHAERNQRSEEERGSAGMGGVACDADTFPFNV